MLMLIIYTDKNGQDWHIEPRSGDLYMLEEMCERLMKGKDNSCNPAKITGPFTPRQEKVKIAGVITPKRRNPKKNI